MAPKDVGGTVGAGIVDTWALETAQYTPAPWTPFTDMAELRWSLPQELHNMVFEYAYMEDRKVEVMTREGWCFAKGSWYEDKTDYVSGMNLKSARLLTRELAWDKLFPAPFAQRLLVNIRWHHESVKVAYAKSHVYVNYFYGACGFHFSEETSVNQHDSFRYTTRLSIQPHGRDLYELSTSLRIKHPALKRLHLVYDFETLEQH